MKPCKIYLSQILMLLFFSLFIASSTISAKQSLLKQFENEVLELVDQVKESIVTVIVETEKNNEPKDPFLPGTTISSGVIYQDCYVITKSTNDIANSQVKIELWDARKLSAELLGIDPHYGLAVLRVYEAGLKPVAIPQKSEMPAGCWILLVGNSLGVPRAVSLGIVNCVRNDGIIQIAGNVPAASLGNPVFNSSGEIVGLLSALINPLPSELNTDPNIVMGDMLLADPISHIVSSVNNIIKNSEQPWLGVGADNWPGHVGGVHIRHIVPGSPASKANLEVGDIILGVEGNKWNQTRGMADYIKGKSPGDTLEFEILRGDKKYIRKLQIGAKGPMQLSGPK
jgi:S1-C subfamily serine protease